MSLTEFQLRIESHLNAIEKILGELDLGDYRLTLIARIEGRPNADIILSRDHAPKIIEAMQRRYDGLVIGNPEGSDV